MADDHIKDFIGKVLDKNRKPLDPPPPPPPTYAPPPPVIVQKQTNYPSVIWALAGLLVVGFIGYYLLKPSLPKQLTLQGIPVEPLPNGGYLYTVTIGSDPVYVKTLVDYCMKIDGSLDLLNTVSKNTKGKETYGITYQSKTGAPVRVQFAYLPLNKKNCPEYYAQSPSR
jgi:hypothetical protein